MQNELFRRMAPRSSLLRLKANHVTPIIRRRRSSGRSLWLKSLIELAGSTRIILVILLVLAFRLLTHNPLGMLKHMHDHTQPTTLFNTYQMGDRAVVLRSWMPPVFFKIKSLNKQFVRSRPIPELQQQPRPSHYQCQHKGDDVPLVFVGVFSTAAAYKRRNLLRLYEKPKKAKVHGRLVEFRFIIGQPGREKDRQLLHKEMESHDDIVLLDEKENINEGKTYAFFRWLAQRPGPKPQFAFKVDDDVRLHSLAS
jgi:hypothetical protein